VHLQQCVVSANLPGKKHIVSTCDDGASQIMERGHAFFPCMPTACASTAASQAQRRQVQVLVRQPFAF